MGASISCRRAIWTRVIIQKMYDKVALFAKQVFYYVTQDNDTKTL